MKHVLITGGSRGIGRACAILAARDGAAISDIETLRVTALEDSEIVLVDVA